MKANHYLATEDGNWQIVEVMIPGVSLSHVSVTQKGTACTIEVMDLEWVVDRKYLRREIPSFVGEKIELGIPVGLFLSECEYVSGILRIHFRNEIRGRIIS